MVREILLETHRFLKIKVDESFIVEDKKAHKTLGVYLGVDFRLNHT